MVKTNIIMEKMKIGDLLNSGDEPEEIASKTSLSLDKLIEIKNKNKL